MNDSGVPAESWVERIAEQSPTVKRSRARSVEQALAIVRAAERLIAVRGDGFTTVELVKEAGIALKTFYRYFEGKDQLVLVVLEQMVSEAATQFREAAKDIDDPVERLRFYVRSVILVLAGNGTDRPSPRFVTAEHWRLQSLYPNELAQATKPFVDLLEAELQAGIDSGQIRRADPAYTSWLLNQVVVAVYHHYAFAPAAEPYEQIADRLWEFCSSGMGVGQDRSAPRRRAAIQPLDGNHNR